MILAGIATAGAAGLASGCEAASPGLGRDALLQVEGAQWRPGPAPEAAGGPEVASVLVVRTQLLRDTEGQRIGGAVGVGATAVWIGLDGDAGGWIVTAGPPSIDTPTSPSFAASIALSTDAPLGDAAVRLVAIDRGERPGVAHVEGFVVEDVAPPTGELVVALGWDGAADLDLHVVAPDGGEAWSGDPNTWEPPPPGTPLDPTAWRTGGLLDRDANARCRRDARPREHVIWKLPPPRGRYTVRVDARAMCGAASAYFYVALYRNDVLLASGQGLATPEDVRLPHGAGQGLTVLEVDVP